jgi:DNA invertase Pin-like site-specific DNA recombinase
MKAQVVTTKVDRCSRVSAIANDLLGRGVVSTIELAGQTDEFVSYLHAGLAARELRVGSARTKAGMAAAMARGVIMGNRTNLPEAQESGRQAMRSKSDKFAALMRPTISRMRSAGMTYEAIAVELNVMGVSTARALSTRSAWHGSSVRNVVNRWGNNAMA